MAEQTRTIRVSTIRTALEWYQHVKGMPSRASVVAADELRAALDSDEYTKKLESQVEALTARIDALERKSAVYGPAPVVDTPPVSPNLIQRALDSATALREK